MRKEEILAIRKSMGLNQGRFAELLGTTLTTICRWEKGKSFPRIKHIVMLKRLQLNRDCIMRFKQNLNHMTI